MEFDNFEADHFFENEKGESHFDPALLEEAHTQCNANCIVSLRAGKGVVISNTCTRMADVGTYAALAKLLGAEFVLIVLHTKHKSIHKVPKHIVEKMRTQLCDTCRNLRHRQEGIAALIQIHRK